MGIRKSQFLFFAMLLACLLAAGCGGPGVPGNVSALADDTSVWVSWTSSSGATNYLVYKSETSGGPYTMVGTTANTSYEVPNLTNGTAYYFVVKAADTKKESDYSAEVSATPVAANVKDDFESHAWGDPLPSPWSAIFGSASVNIDPVSSSKAASTSYGSIMYVHTGVSQQNCDVSIIARGGEGFANTILAVIARHSGSTSATASNYAFEIDVAGNQIQFVKTLSGSGTVIQSAPLPTGFDYVSYHTLRLALQGSTLSGYLDGQLVLTATDTGITDAGSAGFSVINGFACFDNFKVFNK